ncbi:hypothetical protein [Actinoplanes utahensis]|uniref:Uncharacterized protein n=1 Tax=Actinoplanes utahensis TaxID=1869 RepID=A0A0A6UGH0_ACTUT|nr:hypothetical protein [Actinoplanes utahensis]KHD75145.1 hypothetical protein MB27_24845 [Actinoplanes utahensis]GIF27097.1 hypothetical protein Aut01nite_00830 [Actinoplanes utahensis]
MTDPNDDLSSVADSGVPGTSEVPEDLHGDLPLDEAGRAQDGPGVPGRAADSPAAQGSPIGPPD